jgi:hypothetical protein
MGTVSPTGKQIKELMNSADDKPVVMVNLLKFKKITESGEQGREVYDRYGRNTIPILKEIGARVLNTWGRTHGDVGAKGNKKSHKT